jgi:hypothetical protein
MLATRALCRADLGALFDDDKALDAEGFADVWFSDDTQTALKATIERMKTG